ncbi:uncharacterized protein DDB_G0285291-like, partial [Hyalella azteca]|uniref:Uncharacterized protein DDB_G0285291-like n=1 Tax=Hyalella azteca TaxID=294128 RepID=A0A8B7PHX9_HYAAZ
VRSMLQPSVKLGPVRPPAGNDQPRRSFSHQPLPLRPHQQQQFQQQQQHMQQQPQYSNIRNGNAPAHLVAGARRGPGLPPSGPPPQIPTMQPQQLQQQQILQQQLQQRSPDELRHQAIHQLQEQESGGGGDTSPRHSIAEL